MTGDDLRKLRTSRGLTQAQMAAMMKVTVTTICRLETGQNKITPERELWILQAMCNSSSAV